MSILQFQDVGQIWYCKEREKCRIDNNFWLLSINSDRVAEWLRRWTANPVRFPCVGSNHISVGILLDTDRNYKHDEIKATHFATNSLSRKHLVQKSCEKQLTKVSTP